MNAASNKATLWQYRRKKRRILSPVARGLIVGVLFTGWLTYSILYKQKFDFADEDSEADKLSQEMSILNSDEISNDMKASFELSGVKRKIEGVNGQLSLLRKGRSILMAEPQMSLPGEESSKAFHNRVAKDNEGSPTKSDAMTDEISSNEGNKDSNSSGLPDLLKPNDTVGISIEKGAPGMPGGIKGQETSGNDTKCQVPAVDKFPNPLLGRTARLYGGVIFYIFLATYMFIGLAIICDDYFVPALDRISEVLNMPPDIAGATFMAAGSSGPELATAVIGVFVAKDDIGVSGVIGSAIFNITLVIAVCALAAEHDFYLSWWSVIRDCLTYLICIAVLLGTISNEIISWPEALLFLVLYALYCVFMAFSSRIENAIGDKIPVPQSWREVQQGGVEADVPFDEKGATYKNVQGNIAAGSGGGGLVSNGIHGDVDVPLTPNENIEMGGKMKKQNDDLPKKFDDPRAKPEPNAGLWPKFKWAVMYPLYTISHYTIPDCRTEKSANSFVLTFLMAIFWISIYSYGMVWMITVIGSTFLIPDTVMGLTFIAAGVSVPDALAGIAVVREGHGDMAVSNAIGSNVFDILVCLGLPWFMSTAMVHPGSVVKVRSRGLLYSTFSLFSTVIFLILACHVNHWKLDRKFGVILLVWYFIFMTIAAMYELNVFGEYNTQCFRKSVYD